MTGQYVQNQEFFQIRILCSDAGYSDKREVIG